MRPFRHLARPPTNADPSGDRLQWQLERFELNTVQNLLLDLWHAASKDMAIPEQNHPAIVQLINLVPTDTAVFRIKAGASSVVSCGSNIADHWGSDLTGCSINELSNTCERAYLHLIIRRALFERYPVGGTLDHSSSHCKSIQMTLFPIRTANDIEIAVHYLFVDQDTTILDDFSRSQFDPREQLIQNNPILPGYCEKIKYADIVRTFVFGGLHCLFCQHNLYL